MDKEKYYIYSKSIYSTNILKNKKKISNCCVKISIEEKFSEEMRLFVNRVIGKELHFLHEYYKEKGYNLLIRVNDELVAYGRIEFGTIEKNTKGQLKMNNSIHVNRVCVDHEYRGNKFYDTIFLLAIKFAHENQYNSISCMIGTQKQFLHEKIYRYGFRKFYKVLNIPIGWDNFKSTGDCYPFKYSVNKFISIYKIDRVIEKSILNDETFKQYENNFKIFDLIPDSKL